MREIEIKLRVNNLDEPEKKLKEAGCELSESIKQHDVIYRPVNDTRDFTESYEGYIAVRIRKEKGVSKITLKQQRSNEMDNLEYETEVKDGQVMHEILLRLGWKPELEVKKSRKKGKLGEYEICLDQVEELGSYVELEKMTEDDTDPEIIINELFLVLEPFGLSRDQEEKRGYDTQIYQLKNKN